MIRLPPVSTRTDTLVPSTTPFRSAVDRNPVRRRADALRTQMLETRAGDCNYSPHRDRGPPFARDPVQFRVAIPAADPPDNIAHANITRPLRAPCVLM